MLFDPRLGGWVGVTAPYPASETDHTALTEGRLRPPFFVGDYVICGNAVNRNQRFFGGCVWLTEKSGSSIWTSRRQAPLDAHL